jgi:hypothetical protein
MTRISDSENVARAIFSPQMISHDMTDSLFKARLTPQGTYSRW